MIPPILMSGYFTARAEEGPDGLNPTYNYRIYRFIFISFSES